MLVIPKRPVARLHELDEDELSCLMKSIKAVGSSIEKAYGASALTIACQDGKASGQSIAHVHFHILPRGHTGDLFKDKNDDIYPALEKAEFGLKVDSDENRKARCYNEMDKEARWLETFFV